MFSWSSSRCSAPRAVLVKFSQEEENFLKKGGNVAILKSPCISRIFFVLNFATERSRLERSAVRGIRRVPQSIASDVSNHFR